MPFDRPLESLAGIPSRFEVGHHVVTVIRIQEGRWKVELDSAALAGTYRSQVEAWEAGVSEADRVDHRTK
jgi:hypothetical protein